MPDTPGVLLNEKTYSEAQTRSWLSWLARNLQRHGESIFMVERLQPTWLERRGLRAAYHLTFSVVLGLILGVAMEAGFLASEGISLERTGLEHGLLEWFVIIPLWLTLVGRLEERRRRAGSQRSGRLHGFGRLLWEGLVDYLIWCVMFFLAGLALGRATAPWMLHPILAGFIMVVLYEVRIRILADPRQIQPVEQLGGSRERAIKGALVGFAGGLVLYVVLVVVDRTSWVVSLPNLVMYPAVGTAGGALFGFWEPRMAENAYPNQGISLSLRNGVMTALVASPLIAIVFFGSITLPEPWGFGATTVRAGEAAVRIALVVLICAFLWYGGLAVLRHAILRLLIRVEGKPLDLVPFLEHARRLHFLQRAGSGYLFVHRYVMEHFAEIEDA